MLNLLNNAFYAVAEKKRKHPENYEPQVSVSTVVLSNTNKGRRAIFISVSDNGNGISLAILDKIFQPFLQPNPPAKERALACH